MKQKITNALEKFSMPFDTNSIENQILCQDIFALTDTMG